MSFNKANSAKTPQVWECFRQCRGGTGTLQHGQDDTSIPRSHLRNSVAPQAPRTSQKTRGKDPGRRPVPPGSGATHPAWRAATESERGLCGAAQRASLLSCRLGRSRPDRTGEGEGRALNHRGMKSGGMGHRRRHRRTRRRRVHVRGRPRRRLLRTARENDWAPCHPICALDTASSTCRLTAQGDTDAPALCYPH